MLALAALAACHKDRKPEHLLVGAARLRISLPVFLAADQGLFRAHGLDVELREYDTAQPMVNEVVAGRIDAAGFAAYPIIFLASKGGSGAPHLATALVEDPEHRLSYFLAPAGKSLSFPRDLAGKKIGILPTVAYRRWLEAITKQAGVEVTIVPVEPALEAQSLAEGGVNLLFTGDPMATAIVSSGKGVIVDDGPPCAARIGNPFAFGSFLLGDGLATRSPERAARLVAAIDDAIRLARSDPALARQVLARHLSPAQKGLAEHYPQNRYLTSDEVPAHLARAGAGQRGAARNPHRVERGRGLAAAGALSREAGLRLDDVAAGCLGGITLAIAAGERVAVLGSNGAGKTTLLRVLAGLTPPARGRAVLAPPVGYAAQDYRATLLPWFSAERNLTLPVRAAGLAAPARAEQQAEALAVVGLPAELLGRRPGRLSGGEQQKLVLARALVARPRTLILDEPCSALDLGARLALRRGLLSWLAKNSATLVLASHDLDDVLALCERALVIGGRPARILRDLPLGARPELRGELEAALT